MPRPLGVTILAVLYFCFTAFLTVIGLTAILGMGFLVQILARNQDLDPTAAAALSGAGIVVALFFFGLAVLLGFLGYGMWNLRSWARTVAIVLSIIGALFGALGTLFALMAFEPLSVFLSGLRLGVNLLILWYLNQPHVKQAFTAQSLPPAGVARA